jgi:hypothetical protein
VGGVHDKKRKAYDPQGEQNTEGNIKRILARDTTPLPTNAK